MKSCVICAKFRADSALLHPVGAFGKMVSYNCIFSAPYVRDRFFFDICDALRKSDITSYNLTHWRLRNRKNAHMGACQCFSFLFAGVPRWKSGASAQGQKHDLRAGLSALRAPLPALNGHRGALNQALHLRLKKGLQVRRPLLKRILTRRRPARCANPFGMHVPELSLHFSLTAKQLELASRAFCTCRQHSRPTGASNSTREPSKWASYSLAEAKATRGQQVASSAF